MLQIIANEDISAAQKVEAKKVLKEQKVKLLKKEVLVELTKSEEVNEVFDSTMVENFDVFKESIRESEEAIAALTKSQLKVKNEILENQAKMQEIERKKQEEELKAVKKALADMNSQWEDHFSQLKNHKMVMTFCPCSHSQIRER